MSNIKYISCFLFIIFLNLTSCLKDNNDISVIDNISIKIQYKEDDFKDTRFIGKEVELKNNLYSYKVVTDSEGYASFEGVIPGVYNLAISFALPREDYDNLKNPQVEANEILVNGNLSGMKIYEDYYDELTLSIGIKQSLIFSKVYYSGLRDKNNKTYIVDQYIELYNNSGDTISTDNIYLGLVETESSPWFSEFIENNVYLKCLYKLPQQDLKPGESILIARQALDHRIDAPNSIDLSIADYEIKASGKPQNSNVKNLPLIYDAYGSIDYLNMLTGGANQLLLFKHDGVILEDFNLKGDPSKEEGKQTRKYLEIPTNIVLDGVEFLKFNATNIDLTKKRFPSTIDNSYQTISTSNGYTGEVMERKVSQIEDDGRIVLQDTNNSLEDFVVTTNLTPRDYTKPELQPQE